MMLIDLAIIFLPAYAYYAQLMLIRKEKSMGSFSIYVCAILLISNILRVFFWLTAGFAKSLLLQSLLLIAVMLMLLKECVELSGSLIQHSSLWSKFWRWQTYGEYIRFLLGMTAVLTVITLLLQVFTFGFFGQLLGIISLGLEATLGIPQLFSNWKNKSSEGVSTTMIAMWFIGDFTKTLYFIIEAQPFQFMVCGLIQLIVDTMLIAQIVNYSKKDYFSVGSNQPE